MVDTSIFIITSKDPDQISNKLQAVFNVQKIPPVQVPDKYNSPRGKVYCQLSTEERTFINSYLNKVKTNINYLSLWKAMRTQFGSVSHALLAGYLREFGYSPSSIKTNSGKTKKVWNKI